MQYLFPCLKFYDKNNPYIKGHSFELHSIPYDKPWVILISGGMKISWQEPIYLVKKSWFIKYLKKAETVIWFSYLQKKWLWMMTVINIQNYKR